MNGWRATNDPDPREWNRRALLTVALAVALAVALSAELPLPLIPAAMKGLLFFAALGAVILAIARGESARAPRLTGWDQALMLFLLSLAAGFLVDPAEVARHLEAARIAAPAGTGAG